MSGRTPPLSPHPPHDRPTRDALEGKGPQRRPLKRLGRQLEEVATAVGSSYCRLQMPLKLALGVRQTLAGHTLGALERGGSPPLPFQCIPAQPRPMVNNEEQPILGARGAHTTFLASVDWGTDLSPHLCSMVQGDGTPQAYVYSKWSE